MSRLERRLISRTLATRELQPLLESNVAPEWFTDEEHGEAFQFLLDHYAEYGECPTSELFLSEFPTYDLEVVEDSIEPLLDRLTQRHLHDALVEAVGVASEALQKKNDAEARQILASSLLTLDADSARSSDIDFNATFGERLDHYEEMSVTETLLGIPTGFPMIDQATGGMQRGQLVTVIATPKVGKSTLTLRIAINVNAVVKRVMLISFEMSHQEQSARYDAMVAGVSHERLKQGKLTEADWAKLDATVQVVDHRLPFVEIEDMSRVTTVGGVAAKIEQHKPDLVLIDGVYLMQDELGEAPGSPQALTNITRNMKRLAQRADLPILISTQALTWKVNKKQGVNADSIGYSSSFFQDSDVIIGLQKPVGNDGKEVEDERLLRIVASRNCPTGEAVLRWDWTEAKFEEVEADDTASAGVGTPYRDYE